ncbi:MAG: hypothetical protein H7Y88_11765 [Phycisphaerales bacterium]|nr:hypothetical protein [Phycisphaerales bacterium]
MTSTLSARLAAPIRFYLIFRAQPSIDSAALGALLIDLHGALFRRSIAMTPPTTEHEFTLHMNFPAAAHLSWSLDVRLVPELLLPVAPAPERRLLMLGSHLVHPRVDSLLPSIPIVRARFSAALGDSLDGLLDSSPDDASAPGYAGAISLMRSP